MPKPSFPIRTRHKFALLIGAILLSGILVAAISLWQLKIAADDHHREASQNAVEIAVSIISGLNDQVGSGRRTLSDAQSEALRILRTLRYYRDEYVWINDLTPKSLLHPKKPELEGKDVSDVRDGNGEFLYRKFVSKVRQSGSGYVAYSYVPPNGSPPLPKHSYVHLFEPWGWIVGSGKSLDDTQSIFLIYAWQLATLASLCIVLVGSLAYWVAMSIGRQLGGDPDYAKEIANRIARGDLTSKVALKPGDQDSLLHAIDQMQTELRVLIEDIEQSATEVNTSVQQMSAQANEISFASQMQAGSNAETVSTITEIQNSIEAMAALISRIDSRAVKVSEASQQGESLVRDTATDMRNIEQTIQAVDQQMAVLRSRADDVGGIVQIIHDIADQTNLLALNAAIEAARAGEQGRGFAVVADEVRKLAERTSQATNQITSKITQIQGDTRQAAQAMAEVAPQITQGVERSTRAAEFLGHIRSEATTTLSEVGEAATLGQLQVERAKNIVSNVGNITEMLAMTDRAVSEAAQISVALEHSLGRLDTVVKEFRAPTQSPE